MQSSTVSTLDRRTGGSFEVCEQRDVKGLYAKARAGEISNFTGISAPFEEPTNPELDVPTHQMSIEEATAMVVDYINTKIALDQ